MHTLSAAVIKGKSQPTNLKPREGTKIRAVFDLFYNNKGRVVDYNSRKGKNSNNYAILDALTNIYGLDIRHIRKNKWCLVGEWFGKTYIDYTKPPK